ncbi:response regulator [Sulfitobacter aestuariivivens]|uniref:Response regulator n=1 Tax=Sulfitobacter aestuariivivens TaxID=2766981 RepID=A0A927D254_9RHOB|nr:response regulator [Sulfitobacter aestuariivivens]MBD3663693.1 response regulator [Sulfitobacter aestuariivivens]
MALYRDPEALWPCLEIQEKSGSIAKSTRDQAAVKCVAVVAKEMHTCRSIAAILQSWNIDVSTYRDEFSLYSALEKKDANPPDCIIIDVHMLQHTVVEISQNIVAKNARKPGVVILSSIVRGMPEGVNAVSLAKPYEPAQLLEAIHAVAGD